MRRGAALAALAALSVGKAFAQTATPLRLVAPGNDSATSALYAIHAGLFEKAGLDVTLTQMNSGAAVSAAVAGGAADIGLSSLVTIVEAHARGAPFTLVGPSALVQSGVDFAAFVVRKDSPITGPRQLEGKTLASPALRDFNAICIMAWIDQAGGDAQSNRFVELPQPASVPAIVEGRIDGAILGTPTLTAALQSGAVKAIGDPFYAIARRYQYIAWITTQSFADAHRDAIARFSRVMRDAARYANAHPADTAPLVADFDKIDLRVAQSMVRVPFAEYIDPQLIQPLIDATAKYGIIPQRFNAAEFVSPYALKPPR